MTTPAPSDPHPRAAHPATARRAPRHLRTATAAPPADDGDAQDHRPDPPGSERGDGDHADARPGADGAGPPTDADLLVALAHAVEAAFVSDEHPATLVGASDVGDEIELHVDPLEHHPAPALEGFVAPPAWWCLGVIASGRATPLDDGSPAAAGADTTRFPIHLAHFVDRTGTVVRVLRDRRDDTITVHTSAPDELGTGLVDQGVLDDHLRRAMLLPTPPPALGTEVLHGTIWLHRVMAEAAAHQLLDAPWAEVARLHPAFDQLADAALRSWATRHLVRAGELLARAHPWTRIRMACVEGIGPVAGRPAELAGWFDDGSFARAVLGSFPNPEELVADLHVLLRPEVHRRLLEAVDAWGVLDGPGLR